MDLENTNAGASTCTVPADFSRSIRRPLISTESYPNSSPQAKPDCRPPHPTTSRRTHRQNRLMWMLVQVRPVVSTGRCGQRPPNADPQRDLERPNHSASTHYDESPAQATRSLARLVWAPQLLHFPAVLVVLSISGASNLAGMSFSAEHSVGVMSQAIQSASPNMFENY